MGAKRISVENLISGSELKYLAAGTHGTGTPAPDDVARRDTESGVMRYDRCPMPADAGRSTPSDISHLLLVLGHGHTIKGNAAGRAWVRGDVVSDVTYDVLMMSSSCDGSRASGAR